MSDMQSTEGPVQLVCPHCLQSNGLRSVETLQGCAQLNGVTRKADGTVELDYTGETDVIWDTQEWDGKTLGCRNCGYVDLDVDDLVAITGTCVFCDCDLVDKDGALHSAMDGADCPDSEREDGHHEVKPSNPATSSREK